MSSYLGFLERYEEGESFLHKADARLKLVLTLAFIFSLSALPPGSWWAFGIMFTGLWVLVLASRISVVGLLKRTLLAAPFILIALPIVFTRPEPYFWQAAVGPLQLHASYDGFEFFLTTLIRSWISVTAALLLTITTPFQALLDGLRFLRIPRVLVSIVSFMYRYLFVLVDEVLRLLRARSARSATVGLKTGGTISWRARVTGQMAASLFLRTYDRSDRIYMAMLARGYDGSPREAVAQPLPQPQLIAGIATLLGLVAVVAAARLLV